ncbi:chromate resistance protein ChrB domain-containing protein [Niveibacterium sp. SC-1]|uniref:chromate resistance protein ChrB domain-containing protein n=1 Tax=Niveibacterium sp. SC-1 TaxID=3135646 RepID=UPI00311E65DD
MKAIGPFCISARAKGALGPAISAKCYRGANVDFESVVTVCDISYMTIWHVLIATLPSKPSALRVRVWRALKATGAGSLREGVYVLPGHAPTVAALRALESTILQAGAAAFLLQAQARDDAQEHAFRELFDRTAAYGSFLEEAKQARAALAKGDAPAVRAALRQLEQQLRAVEAIDFFPHEARDKARTAHSALRHEFDRLLSPGEPTPTDVRIARLSIADYQGRTWATRRRPWIDRLGSAWLIARFVDAKPQFAWLDDPSQCAQPMLGYDFDGARFSHVGDKVSFEVIAESFGLLDDAGVRKLGSLIRYIDIGGVPVDEAAGLETLIRGLQRLHADDDALLTASLPLFDALHSALKGRDDN